MEDTNEVIKFRGKEKVSNGRVCIQFEDWAKGNIPEYLKEKEENCPTNCIGLKILSNPSVKIINEEDIHIFLVTN